MNFSIRLFQWVALVASVGWAGPPVADWIDREISDRKARTAWEEMRRGNAAAFDGQKVLPRFWLRIPSVDIDTMVIAADSEAQLKRHVGCVEKGRFTVISGHRDLHFRPLKDLREGAAIQLESAEGGSCRFRVTGTENFDTDELASRIEAGGVPGRLALVTCYPFYFVGEAPQRFVAWASPLETESPATPGFSTPRP